MTIANNSQVEQEIITIICEQLDVKPEDVNASKTFNDDLGADSLAIVELVLALEEKFDIKIPDEEVDNIKTVGDAINYIASRRKS
jgi:acyl carrier protein